MIPKRKRVTAGRQRPSCFEGGRRRAPRPRRDQAIGWCPGIVFPTQGFSDGSSPSAESKGVDEMVGGRCRNRLSPGQRLLACLAVNRGGRMPMQLLHPSVGVKRAERAVGGLADGCPELLSSSPPRSRGALGGRPRPLLLRGDQAQG